MADDLIQWDGGALIADMVQDATITDASDLTQYAIEDGSNIVDHVIRQPRTLSLTLVQTETPIAEVTGFSRVLASLAYPARPDAKQTLTVPVRQSEFRPAPLMALSGAVRSLLFGGGPVTEVSFTGVQANGPLANRDLKVHVLAAGSPVDRVNLFHANLLSLLETATPVFVTIKGASYIDMVLTSVTRSDAGGQAGRASFSVEFRQITTVETKVVTLPPVPQSKAPRQLGARPTTQASPSQEEKALSSFEVFSSSESDELFSSEPGT